MDQTCDATAERITESLGFSCRHADPIATFRDPFRLSNGTMPVLELLIVAGAVFGLLHAWRRWRREGDPVNITLWFASVAYLAVIEPPLYFPGWFGLDKQVGFIFAHNVFTVQFMYDRLPLYIVAFYPALSQLAYELVRTSGVFQRRGAVGGSLAVAFVCQVFYEIFDQLGPRLRWWAWNPDNVKVNQPAFASVPMNSMFLFASVSFAGLVYVVVRLAGARLGAGAGVGTGAGIAWRSVVAGVLAPVAMMIAGIPAGAFQGDGHLAVQRAVIGVELAIVWVVGMSLMIDAWRAPRAGLGATPLFSRTFPAIYLGVLAALWLVGLTRHGGPKGSLWYSALCAAVATGVIVTARRATSPPRRCATTSPPRGDPVRS